MTKSKDKTPDYKAFAQDMLKLCKKHHIHLRAHDQGTVILGSASSESLGAYPYAQFSFSPKHVFIGNPYEMGYIEIKK